MRQSFFAFVDEYDAYIVVSFVNATLVLSIGETVEEITDSGFLGTTPTLTCSLLGDDALLQVVLYYVTKINFALSVPNYIYFFYLLLLQYFV